MNPGADQTPSKGTTASMGRARCVGGMARIVLALTLGGGLAGPGAVLAQPIGGAPSATPASAPGPSRSPLSGGVAALVNDDVISTYDLRQRVLRRGAAAKHRPATGPPKQLVQLLGTAFGALDRSPALAFALAGRHGFDPTALGIDPPHHQQISGDARSNQLSNSFESVFHGEVAAGFPPDIKQQFHRALGNLVPVLYNGHKAETIK